MTATSYVTDADLERRAAELLTRYEGQEGPIVRPPVPIDLIIELVLDIEIDWAPIAVPSEGERVLAAIELTPTRRRILMNERERQHFSQFFGTAAYSKAHEVGHAILHLQTPGLQPALWGAATQVLCRSDQRNSQEIQAERFAAYLLMPEPLVRATAGDRPITGWP